MSEVSLQVVRSERHVSGGVRAKQDGCLVWSSAVERIWHIIRQSRPDSGLGFQVSA